MSPDLAAITPLGQRTALLAITPNQLTSGCSVLTPLRGRSQQAGNTWLACEEGPPVLVLAALCNSSFLLLLERPVHTTS